MARQGDLPKILGSVDVRTGTPLIATALVTAMVTILALAFPLERLAEGTSIATLATFALVNLSLLRIKARGIHSEAPHIRVGAWVPALGLAACLLMIATSFLG